MSKRSWLREIPTSRKILEEAIAELDFEVLLRSNKPASELARAIEKKCHEIYQRYEDAVRRKWKDNADSKVLEQSLQQSKMSRAGRTTELILKLLLDKFGIRYEEKPLINGERPDFVIPNVETLKKNAKKAVILSVKRKVRERWREVVAEAYILRKIQGIPDNIWFVTLECDIPEYAVEIISKLDMRIYIPDECYERFSTITNTLPLSKLFENLIHYSTG